MKTLGKFPVIALTGASGQVGSRIAAKLAGLGAPLRLIVRDSTRAPRYPNVDIVQIASYQDNAGMKKALSGIDRLFLMSARDRFGVAHISAKNHEPPPADYDRLRQHCAAIDVAIAAGVRHVIYLSVIRPAPEAPFILARDHFHTEQYILAKGVAYTFLRAGLYIDNLPQYVSDDDIIRAPAGNGRSAWIARDDIAAAAVSILTGDEHEARVYDATGPEALTMDETADRLSCAVGRKIVYQSQTVQEARTLRATSRLQKFEAERRMLTGRGLDEYEVEVFVTHFTQIAAGELSGVSNDVFTLTGRPAQSLAQYLQTHPESYHHLLR
jgi:NAD(P)H dehydrogenase (quinone)